MSKIYSLMLLIALVVLSSCGSGDNGSNATSTDLYPNVTAAFSGKIDLTKLDLIMRAKRYLPISQKTIL